MTMHDISRRISSTINRFFFMFTTATFIGVEFNLSINLVIEKEAYLVQILVKMETGSVF